MIHFGLYQKKGCKFQSAKHKSQVRAQFTPTQRKERTEKSKFPDFSKQPKNNPLIYFRIFSRGNKAQKGF